MAKNIIEEYEYDVLKNVEGFEYLIKDKNGKICYGRDIEKYDFLTGEWITDVEKVPVSDSYLYKDIQWNNEEKIDIQELLIIHEVAYMHDDGSMPTISDMGKDMNYEINQSQLTNMFGSFLSERTDNDVIRDNIQEIGEAVFDFMVDFKEKNLKLDIERDANNG